MPCSMEKFAPDGAQHEKGCAAGARRHTRGGGRGDASCEWVGLAVPVVVKDGFTINLILSERRCRYRLGARTADRLEICLEYSDLGQLALAGSDDCCTAPEPMA